MAEAKILKLSRHVVGDAYQNTIHQSKSEPDYIVCEVT